MRSDKKEFLSQICHRIWKDIESARWAIIVVIAYFVFLKLLTGSACPVVAATGFPCPACGLTRAFVCLLHLDFQGAFRTHAYIYALVIYLSVFCWNRYVRGKQMGRKLTILAVVVIVGMAGYYIWRMIHYFPGDPPMSYYYHNLWYTLKNLLARDV